MNTYKLIINTEGAIIHGDFPSELKNITSKINSKSVKFDVEINGKKLNARAGIEQNKNGTIYLLTTETKYIKSSKLFYELLKMSVITLDSVVSFNEKLSLNQNEYVQDLIHNLTSLNTYNIQDLYSLIPQQILSDNINKQKDVIKNIVTEKPKITVNTLLKLIKYNSAMKVEFSVFEKTVMKNPKVQKIEYSIRNAILSILQIFIDDFENKKIQVTVDSNWGVLPNIDSQYQISKKGDVISSSSLSAGNNFNFRFCTWDNSVNSNEKCTDYHGIAILSSNLVPEITPLSVHDPDFCSGELNYLLDWEFSDPDDDGQGSYEIQVKEGDNNFNDTANLVIDNTDDDKKNSPDSSYQILSADFVNGNEMEYGKTYYWRTRVTDDRGGGYEQTTSWEEGPQFTTPTYEYPQIDFNATPDHSSECLYEVGYSGVADKCDFGEDIIFSDNSTFVECNNSDNAQCVVASAARCDTNNWLCVACDNDSQCVKFGAGYKCEGGVCNPPEGFVCATDNDCMTAEAAKCEEGICVACDDDSQCSNVVSGYVCRSNGVCEDPDRREWYFYSNYGGTLNSADPYPVNNYIESVVDSYIVTLKVKDILGNTCLQNKNIFLGGKKYPKWNEISPSGS